LEFLKFPAQKLNFFYYLKPFTVFLILMVPIWYSISFLWFLAPKYADETCAFGPCVAWMQAGLRNYCHFTIEAERISVAPFLAAFHRIHLNWVLSLIFICLAFWLKLWNYYSNFQLWMNVTGIWRLLWNICILGKMASTIKCHL